MPTLAFLGLVRPELIPPILRDMGLPKDPAALHRLQSCECVPQKYADWISTTFLKAKQENNMVMADIPPHRLFFFALVAHASTSLDPFFPQCTPDQKRFIHRYALALNGHLVKLNHAQPEEKLKAEIALQGIVFKAYEEHVRATQDEAVQSARASLRIPFSLVPESIVPGLMLLRTMGWTRLPRAFCARAELPALSAPVVLGIALRRLPTHVQGFSPERALARQVFGDADRAALHEFFVLQSCIPSQTAQVWKMLGWPTDRTVMRGLRQWKPLKKVSGEDVRCLLQALR